MHSAGFLQRGMKGSHDVVNVVCRYPDSHGNDEIKKRKENECPKTASNWLRAHLLWAGRHPGVTIMKDDGLGFGMHQIESDEMFINKADEKFKIK